MQDIQADGRGGGTGNGRDYERTREGCEAKESLGEQQQQQRRQTTESSLPSRQPTEITGLTAQLGLSDISAISSHHDSSVDDEAASAQSSSERASLLLEEQQELRVNLLLVGRGEEEERERLSERLRWTQEELKKLER